MQHHDRPGKSMLHSRTTISLEWYIPCIQTGSRLPGTVWRGLIFFTTDHPDYHRMPPPAGDNHGWVVFAVRTGFALGHRASTFYNNSCAISITSPRSLFRPRTQHGRWGHREKSRRASTRWDCRGKSCLAGLSPLSGTPSECHAWRAWVEWGSESRPEVNHLGETVGNWRFYQPSPTLTPPIELF